MILKPIVCELSSDRVGNPAAPSIQMKSAQFSRCGLTQAQTDTHRSAHAGARRHTQAHAGVALRRYHTLSQAGYPFQLFCFSTVAISIGFALFFLGRIHRLKTRNLSCPVPLSAVVMPIRCGKCYAEMVSTVPGRFPSYPFCDFEDTAPADVRHQSLVSLGGLPSC